MSDWFPYTVSETKVYGNLAGNEGYNKKIEAIQIQLVKKNGAAPGNTDNHFYKR